MKLLYFLIALIIILPLSVISETILTYVYYAMLIIVSIFTTVRSSYFRYLKLDLKSVLFLLVGFLSLVLNNVDYRYNAWLKFMGFLMVMLVFGPLIKNEFSAKLKRNIFYYMKTIIVIATILSLCFYLLKLPFATLYGIGGVFNQSMVLSPIAAISSLICLDNVLHPLKKLSKKNIFSIILLFCSIATSMIAASRGAILALIIGILVYLVYRYKYNTKRLLLSLFFMTILGFVIIVYNPMAILDNLIYKLDRTPEMILSGRENMWKDRISDFKESPLIGVGFSTFKETFNSKIDFQKRKQEAGSSWFLILGSMGLLGIVTYILLLFIPFFKIWNKRDFDVGLNIAMLFFFAVHTAIEGYAISFGSTLCTLMWLNVGMLNVRINSVKNEKI